MVGVKKTSTGSVASKSNSEKLVVTVIPVNEDPYSKTIQIPHSLIGKRQSLCFCFRDCGSNLIRQLAAPNQLRQPAAASQLVPLTEGLVPSQ